MFQRSRIYVSYNMFNSYTLLLILNINTYNKYLQLRKFSVGHNCIFDAQSINLFATCRGQNYDLLDMNCMKGGI